MNRISCIIILLLLSQSIYPQPFKWSNPIIISENINENGYAQNPDIFIDKNDTIHVVYRFFSSVLADLFYIKGNGSNWSKPERLTDSLTIYNPKIVVNDSGNVFITYEKNAGWYTHIFSITNENGVWKSPVLLSRDSLQSGFYPHMVIDKDNIITVFYSGYDGLYWLRYINGEWSEAENLISAEPSFLLTIPKAAVDRNNYIHLIYNGNFSSTGISKLFYMVYDGIFWSEPVKISDNDSLTVQYWDVAVNTMNLPHIIYTQINRSINPQLILFYSKRNKFGWEVPIALTKESDGDVYFNNIEINPLNNRPLITARSGGNIKVVYYENEDWVIENILKDYPEITAFSYDLNFDPYGKAYYIFARTDLSPQKSYIYYAKGDVITDVEITDEKKADEIKISAFPNPFNSSTEIQYQIPNNGNISIAVYDVTGQELETIFEGYQEKGEHRISYNTSSRNYVSGIYFIRLSAGKFIKTIKTLLIK